MDITFTIIGIISAVAVFAAYSMGYRNGHRHARKELKNQAQEAVEAEEIEIKRYALTEMQKLAIIAQNVDAYGTGRSQKDV